MGTSCSTPLGFREHTRNTFNMHGILSKEAWGLTLSKETHRYTATHGLKAWGITVSKEAHRYTATRGLKPNPMWSKCFRCTPFYHWVRCAHSLSEMPSGRPPALQFFATAMPTLQNLAANFGKFAWPSWSGRYIPARCCRKQGAWSAKSHVALPPEHPFLIQKIPLCVHVEVWAPAGVGGGGGSPPRAFLKPP